MSFWVFLEKKLEQTIVIFVISTQETLEFVEM